MKVGDVVSWERVFTEEDVQLFAQVSKDQGIHHMQRDASGRLLVHGLLTATLPTKIGGDLNFIAREMVFHFIRPVYAGELIQCTVTVTDLEDAPDHTQLAAAWICTNAAGKEVLTGRAQGIVLNRGNEGSGG
jgi:acyl dehydratase